MAIIFSHGRRVQPLVQFEIVREFRYGAELEVHVEQLEYVIEIEQIPELEVPAP